MKTKRVGVFLVSAAVMLVGVMLSRTSIGRSGRNQDLKRTPVSGKGVELYPVRIGKKSGYINRTGAIAIKTEFRFCGSFMGDRARVASNLLWAGDSGHVRGDQATGVRLGFVDRSGRIVVEPRFWAAEAFSEGLASVGVKAELGQQSVVRRGFIDSKGKFIVPPRFSRTGSFSEGMARVMLGGGWQRFARGPRVVFHEVNGDWGYVTKDGKIAITTRFSEAGDFREGLAYARPTAAWGFIDTKGKIAIPPQFDETGNFKEGLVKVKAGLRWGYVKNNGEYLIEPIFDDATDFSGGFARVSINDKWGCIDKKGKLIVELKFDGIDKFSEGFAAVRSGATWDTISAKDFGSDHTYIKGGSWGYIDESGRIVVEPKYESASHFSNGLAAVKTDGKWGYIDPKGKVVIDPRFSSCSSFSEGLAAVSLDDGRTSYGFIDKRGKFVLQPRFWSAGSFVGGMAPVQTRGAAGFRYGYIGKNGKYIIQPMYKSAGAFDGKGRALVSRDGRSFYIDKNGKEDSDYYPVKVFLGGWWEVPEGTDKVTPDSRWNFSEGLARVRVMPKGKGVGYINKKGKFVIEPKFNAARSFSAGLAGVSFGGKPRNKFSKDIIGGKWGFIDKSGKFVIQPTFYETGDFSEGLASVRTGWRKWGYIDAKGRIAVKPQFRDAGQFAGGLARVCVDVTSAKKRKWGYIDRSGKMVIKPTFDKAEDFANGLARVESARLQQYIDKNGRTIWKERP